MTPGTLFPHTLIDQVLPTLSGTQWQLLCILIRQTQGWHDPQTGGRKQSDWLSHGQLRRRTGRGSDALCHAVDALVRRDLIEVRDEQGHSLSTSAERRRSGGRLIYSLSPQLLRHFQPSPPVSKKPLSATKPTSKAESIPVSRFGKAETTKETLTKEKQKKPFGKTEWSRTSESTVAPSQRQAAGFGCFLPLPDPALPDPALPYSASSISQRSEMAIPNQEAVHFREAYRTAYIKYFGDDDREATPLNAEEQARLQAALARYGQEHLEGLLPVFFASDTVFIRRHGHTLPVFLEMLHVLPFLRAKSRP